MIERLDKALARPEPATEGKRIELSLGSRLACSAMERLRGPRAIVRIGGIL